MKNFLCLIMIPYFFSLTASATALGTDPNSKMYSSMTESQAGVPMFGHWCDSCADQTVNPERYAKTNPSGKGSSPIENSIGQGTDSPSNTRGN